MRLTETLREKIADSVISATTYDERIAKARNLCTETLREYLVEQVPVAFVEMTQGRPKEWFHHIGAFRDAWIKGCYETLNFDPFPAPVSHKARLADDQLAEVGRLYAIAKLIEGEKDQSYNEVMRFLRSCSTVEKVTKNMPEFERHIPIQARSYPIAVSTSKMTMVLMGAGFDTTAKKG